MTSSATSALWVIHVLRKRSSLSHLEGFTLSLPLGMIQRTLQAVSYLTHIESNP